MRLLHKILLPNYFRTSKWQVALIIGAPVFVGFGYWYFIYRKRSACKYDKSADACKISSDCSIEHNEINESNKLNEIKNDPMEAKNQGNIYFKNGRYLEALECYDKAIQSSPEGFHQNLATFYQNKAACYEQLKNYDAVKENCSKALEQDPKYMKALIRRAKASEVTNDLQEALEDLTAACILENFQNKQTLLSLDQVVKELGMQQAKKIIRNREYILVSDYSVRMFLASFAEDPLNNLTVAEETTPKGFAKAQFDLRNGKYSEIIKDCSEEMENINNPWIIQAQLLRGTFYILNGHLQNAIEDLSAIIENPLLDKDIHVNALIKRASVYMQNGQLMESKNDFEKAVQINPNNSDLYQHRGQMFLLLNQIDEAIKDFNKAVQLQPNFAMACIQKCYSEFRQAIQNNNCQEAIEKVKELEAVVQKFPFCSEGYSVLGQVKYEQQETDLAESYFQKALQIDPDNGNIYVHKAMLQLQSNGDLQIATNLLNKAIEIDERCELAYETLAMVELQRGNLKEAIQLFNKAIQLAKSETEVAHLCSQRSAAEAQIVVTQKLNVKFPNLTSMFSS